MKNEFMTHEQEKVQEEQLNKYFRLSSPQIPEAVLRRMEKAGFERLKKRHRGRYFMQLATSPWLTIPAAAAAVVLVVSVMLLNSYEISDYEPKGASLQVAAVNETASLTDSRLESLKLILAEQNEDELARMDEHLAAIIDKPVKSYWKDAFVSGWDWNSDGSYDSLAGEDWL